MGHDDARGGLFSNRVSLVKPKMSAFSNRVSLVKPKMSAFQPSFHCQSLRDETSLVLRPPRFPAGLGRNGPSMASKQASLRSTRGQAPKPRSGAPQAPGCVLGMPSSLGVKVPCAT
jgi:hypothetical protein